MKQTALPRTDRGTMGRGTLDQVISRAVFVLSGYALHISMAYLLKDPATYGLLGLMVNVTNIARVLLSTGLPQATTKFIAESDESLAYPILRTSMKLQWLMAAVITAVYLAGIPLWMRFLNDDSLAPYFLASAPLIPLMGGHQVLLGYFGGLRRFRAQSWLNTLYSVGRVAFAIAFVLLGLGVGGVLWGFSAALVVALAVSWSMVQPRNPGPNPESRRLIAFALPLMVLAIGQSFVVNLDLLMLKRFFPGGEEVGFYTGAMNLGSAPYYIFTAFSITMLPLVANALRDNDDIRARRLVARNISFLVVVVAPIVAIVLAVPEALLDFVYPAAYRAGAFALSLLIVSQSLLAVLAALTSAITAKGHPRVAMAVWIVCIPVQLALGFAVIPRLGMAGAAAANLATTLVGVTIASALVWRYFGPPIEPARVAKALVAAAAVYLAMSLPSGYAPLVLPFACLAALVAYGAAMLAMKGITAEEVRSLFKREPAAAAPEALATAPEASPGAGPDQPIDDEVR